MKKLILKLGRFCAENISILCMLAGFLGSLMLLVSWVVGYWANGLYGYHFELRSVWDGVGAMAIGFVGLAKWLIDSVSNSEKGSMPPVFTVVESVTKKVLPKVEGKINIPFSDSETGKQYDEVEEDKK